MKGKTSIYWKGTQSLRKIVYKLTTPTKLTLDYTELTITEVDQYTNQYSHQHTNKQTNTQTNMLTNCTVCQVFIRQIKIARQVKQVRHKTNHLTYLHQIVKTLKTRKTRKTRKTLKIGQTLTLTHM